MKTFHYRRNLKCKIPRSYFGSHLCLLNMTFFAIFDFFARYSSSVWRLSNVFLRLYYWAKKSNVHGIIGAVWGKYHWGGVLAQSQSATIKQGTFLTFTSDNIVYVYTHNTPNVKVFLKFRLYKRALCWLFCPIIYRIFKIITFLNPWKIFHYWCNLKLVQHAQKVTLILKLCI